ncbi:MAG: glycosyltransferase, partial [Pseudomonadota bacterium]
ADRGWPWLMPAFDLERFLEQGYAAQALAVRRDDLLHALKAGAESVYDIVLSTVTRHGRGAVGHVPGAHLRCPPADPAIESRALLRASRRWLADGEPGATVSATDRAGLRIHREPLARALSVIIPTRDHPDLLRTCIGSLVRHDGDIAIELIVVDNGSREPEALAYLDALKSDGARILRDDRAFNYARMNNDAVALASNEAVCLLNNDTEFVEPVFAEMLGRLRPADVGAVGVLMARETDVIQHGGVVLGSWHGAAHAFEDRMLGDEGYGRMLTTAHEVSAVTAACMVLRKADFLGVGGFDARRFPITFNDVDLCLKLRAAGKRIVMTPHVHIKHHESASRGHDADLAKRARAARELALLRQRWGHVLTDDPYYNPCLSLGTYPYAGLAALPRRMEGARRNIGLPPLEEPFPT